MDVIQCINVAAVVNNPYAGYKMSLNIKQQSLLSRLLVEMTYVFPPYLFISLTETETVC